MNIAPLVSLVISAALMFPMILTGINKLGDPTRDTRLLGIILFFTGVTLILVVHFALGKMHSRMMRKRNRARF